MATKIKSFSLTFVLIFILGMATSCSTKGSFKMQESIEKKTIKGAVVALIVTPPNSNGNDVAIQLRGQLASYLLGAGLFKSIAGQCDQNVEYEISIKLTTIDEVSGVSRVMLGVMAGSNKIAGDVTVTDVKTGQTVRSFSFHAESASHPYSGKSDIKDAINRAAEEIINGLS